MKPLFFAWIGDTLVFASAVKAIRWHPEYRARPNWSVLSHYLTTLRLTLGRETVYDGIFTLQPGERLVWEQGRVRIERYWQPPAEEEADDFATAADALDERLRESVRLRLVGDVPAGLLLSGGVDSNTLASISGEEVGSGVPAGCGVCHEQDGAPALDATFAEAAARHTGCEL